MTARLDDAPEPARITRLYPDISAFYMNVKGTNVLVMRPLAGQGRTNRARGRRLSHESSEPPKSPYQTGPDLDEQERGDER